GIAGLLHDIGKLSVPEDILEKPAPLDCSEVNKIKAHSFMTHRILENIGSLDKITQWASLHHERLNGTGYPYHYGKEKLPVGARIIAVADVFTALTENRPYRKG